MIYVAVMVICFQSGCMKWESPNAYPTLAACEAELQVEQADFLKKFAAHWVETTATAPPPMQIMTGCREGVRA